MLDPEQYTEEATAYTCRRCQRKLLSLDADGEHEDCERREIDHDKRREAIRRLRRYTARMLRERGWPEEAARLELDAEGKW